jgi:hypothetical protein
MPIRPEADDVIAFLNDLATLDPDFMAALVRGHFPCNVQLAQHPSVQCAFQGDGFTAGFLGVLNGFLGTIEHGQFQGWGPIIAVFDMDKPIRFERTQP